ncbi:ATP-binding protein [Deinococcus kurensis]|uniref:ATP-binding protein n=1 Tax=Deinococcus kurensis TaxID=2662757 RepID=UPI0012D31CD8|nr:ATP-binding protein [Deinococcus kurensis]
MTLEFAMSEVLDRPAPVALLIALTQLAAAWADTQDAEAITAPALQALQAAWHPAHATWIAAAELTHAPQAIRDAADAGATVVFQGSAAQAAAPSGPAATVALLPCAGPAGLWGAAVLTWTAPYEFTEADLAAWHAWCTQVTLSLTRLFQRDELDRQVARRTHELEEDRLALDAFVAYKEAVGGASDVFTLARQAEQVLRTKMPHLSAAYYELDAGRWTARVWSDDLPPDLAAAVQDGVPAGTLNFAQAHDTQGEVFVDGWDAAANHLPGAGAFGAAAFLPLTAGGRVRSVFAVGKREAPHWSDREKALIRAVTRGLQVTLERTEHLRQLEAERAALDAFVQFAEASSHVADPQELAERATAVLSTTLDVHASFLTLQGQQWVGQAFSQSVGADTRLVVRRGLPASWPNLQRPFEVEEAVFIDQWEPETQASAPTGLYYAAALYPYRRSGHPHGLLVIGSPRRGAWTDRERSVFRAVGRSLSLAFERVDQNDQLAETARALEAFMAYTEAIGTRTDVHALAAQAISVLEGHFPQSSVGYFEPEQSLWKIRAWNGAFPPELLSVLQAGVPENPVITELLRTRAAVFVDLWDAQAVNLQESGGFGSGVNVPLIVDGTVHGILGIGRPDATHWQPQEQALVRAVARGLTLAMERAAAAQTLADQNAELTARARALEGIAELTRDLSISGDPAALLRQTQALALSLLPEGCALYYELDGDRWRCRSQVGLLHGAGLQAAVDAGLPYEQTQNLVIPWTTGDAYFQDLYDHDTDGLGDLTLEVGATATLPIHVGTEILGIFAVALRTVRQWTATDRAVLETIVRQLSLALEGVRAHEALNRTRHYLEVAVANAPMLLFAVDAQGIFTLFEGDLARRLSDRPQDVIGQSAPELFRHDPTLRHITSLHQAFAGEEVHEVIELSARQIILEAWFVPVLDARGQVTEVVGVALDVTERWTAQQHLESTNAELRRSNAELEQFAYVASHDLQEPLRTVTSFTDLLARKYAPALDERGLQYMGLITQATGRMAQLLEDLLAFARVHQAPENRVRVHTDALVRQVLDDLTGIVRETGAQVDVQTLPDVHADRSQVRQVFQNLIGNALKFAAPERRLTVRIRGRQVGDRAEFTVEDNGIGIDPQFHERIFTIFQRLHTRDHYAGNGIGLSISRKIVERHGGALTVTSAEGRGSTFAFTLPVAPPAETG